LGSVGSYLWGTNSSGSPSSSQADGSELVGKYNPKTNDYVFGQKKAPGQHKILSTERIVSSIQKSDFNPGHQPKESEPQGTAAKEKWVYPSEQQYYNAMKRKGYDPKEDDMGVVLAIHNVVNEQGWGMVKCWEALSSSREPKLRQFMGRPTDISPKARILNFLYGYSLPFDRHDWVIEREDGKQVRYVLDFYKGKPSAQSPVSIHLDVRPALDSPEALLTRAKVSFDETFLGKSVYGSPAVKPNSKEAHKP
jgi:cytochrome c heme-lyase